MEARATMCYGIDAWVRRVAVLVCIRARLQPCRTTTNANGFSRRGFRSAGAEAPIIRRPFSARLKSCPDTILSQSSVFREAGVWLDRKRWQFRVRTRPGYPLGLRRTGAMSTSSLAPAEDAQILNKNFKIQETGASEAFP
jgi:hypothetical protein